MGVDALASAILAHLSLVLGTLVALTLVVSLGLVWYVDRPNWGDTLCRRLVMGVPWGTFVTMTFVLLVYLFVQGGWSHWYDPVTLPFRSWSYFYPIGMVTSAFSHAGAGHLLGNLFGTLVAAPIAEYAWGHYPRRRGSETFRSWKTNPWVRALVVFPSVSIAVGLLTAVFGLGPTIGFSGVVFAYIGFGLVTRPMTTLVAVLGGQGALSLLYNVLRKPILTVSPSPRPPSAPWWAGIAIQGHALGLVVGVLLGIAVLRAYDERPFAFRVWVATLFFALEQGLWAVYWFGDNSTYVLLRGPGYVLVVLLAMLVTLAATASERVGFGDLSRRQVGMAVLLVVSSGLAGPAIATNFMSVGDATAPDHGVHVHDYTVFYAEDVENEMVSVIDFGPVGDATSTKTSGVIVVSERRGVWVTELSKGQLAFHGRKQVDVGGVGWRESVTVVRRGWDAQGGGTAYAVWVKPPDGSARLAYNSDPATADPVVAGRNVSVVPRAGQFYLYVTSEGETLGSTQIPEDGESATAGGLTFERTGKSVYAVYEDTRVKVAKREQYRGN